MIAEDFSHTKRGEVVAERLWRPESGVLFLHDVSKSMSLFLTDVVERFYILLSNIGMFRYLHHGLWGKEPETL